MMGNRWRESIWVRRGAFIAAHVGLALAIFNLAILPVHDFVMDRDAQVGEQRAVLARLTAIANQESTVLELAKRGESDNGQAEFLHGPNDGAISADLQTRLKSLAQAANARLRSIRALPARTNDDAKFVGAQIELTGTHRAIEQAVYAVETAKPYLFLVAAAIKPTAQMRAPVNSAGVTEEPTLDAQFDIVGAVQIEGRR
jgi:hypothetical protein